MPHMVEARMELILQSPWRLDLIIDDIVTILSYYHGSCYRIYIDTRTIVSFLQRFHQAPGPEVFLFRAAADARQSRGQTLAGVLLRYMMLWKVGGTCLRVFGNGGYTTLSMFVGLVGKHSVITRLEPLVLHSWYYKCNQCFVMYPRSLQVVLALLEVMDGSPWLDWDWAT